MRDPAGALLGVGGGAAQAAFQQEDHHEMSWTNRIKGFASEVRVEVGKVSWPTRAELLASTKVVVATVLVVALFIGVVDRLLTSLLGLLFG